MPRTARQWVPGDGAHVISRFVDRRFHLVDDHDRAEWLASVGKADERWDWTWLSYAAMSSHLHSGFIAGSVDPDRFFRSSHTRFAQRYHARESRETLGPVFAARPAIHPVRESMLPRMVAYHHRNPVEAGVVGRPSDSTWTSHRAYMRMEPAPPWLDVERALDILGFDDTAAGRRRFDEFVMEVDLSGFAPGCAGPGEATLRRGTREDEIDWQRLIGIAREVNGMTADERIDSRSRRAARTRRIVAIVATRDLGQTYASVARQLGVHTGSLYNLVTRPGRGAARDVDAMVVDVRQRLVAAA